MGGIGPLRAALDKAASSILDSILHGTINYPHVQIIYARPRSHCSDNDSKLSSHHEVKPEPIDPTVTTYRKPNTPKAVRKVSITTSQLDYPGQAEQIGKPACTPLLQELGAGNSLYQHLPLPLFLSFFSFSLTSIYTFFVTYKRIAPPTIAMSDADYDFISPFSLSALDTGDDNDVPESSLSSPVQNLTFDDGESCVFILDVPTARLEDQVPENLEDVEGSTSNLVTVPPRRGCSCNHCIGEDATFAQSVDNLRSPTFSLRRCENESPPLGPPPRRLLLQASVEASATLSTLGCPIAVGESAFSPGSRRERRFRPSQTQPAPARQPSFPVFGGPSRRLSPVRRDSFFPMYNGPPRRLRPGHEGSAESQAVDAAFLASMGGPRPTSGYHNHTVEQDNPSADTAARPSVLGDAMRLAMRLPANHPVNPRARHPMNHPRPQQTLHDHIASMLGYPPRSDLGGGAVPSGPRTTNRETPALGRPPAQDRTRFRVGGGLELSPPRTTNGGSPGLGRPSAQDYRASRQDLHECHVRNNQYTYSRRPPSPLSLESLFLADEEDEMAQYTAPSARRGSGSSDGDDRLSFWF